MTWRATCVRPQLQDAFDYLAMGNYPYASSYILNGDGMLPPYPFRLACSGPIAQPSLVGSDRVLQSTSFNTFAKPCMFNTFPRICI
jgi:hypothetical protein